MRDKSQRDTAAWKDWSHFEDGLGSDSIQLDNSQTEPHPID
jgi:hypothetical protein